MPVIDTEKGQMDVISRLLKDRILLLGQGVDDEVANVLVAQLLYLANEDPEKDITLYINSPVRFRRLSPWTLSFLQRSYSHHFSVLLPLLLFIVGRICICRDVSECTY